MNVLSIELRKEKRTGVIPVLLAVGVLGAAYAFVNFLVRKDTLLNLPLDPMDVLLTQLYGVIMILNLFGIVVATCMVYNMEFKGSAIKKMYMLPMSVPAMYLCKFLILTVMFLVAIVLQNLALMQIGMTDLPEGAFEMGTLVRFAGYSFLTSMPVLSFMLLISSRFENMWIPLGVYVDTARRWSRRIFKRYGAGQFKSCCPDGSSFCAYAETGSCHERPARYDCDRGISDRDCFVPCYCTVAGKKQTL